MESKILYSLSIGGTKCALAVWREEGGKYQLLSKDTFATLGRDENAVLADFFALMDSKADKPDAIGVICGGPLDEKEGVILAPPNLNGWERVEITEILSRRYGVPARLLNDANTGALAEHRFGAGQGKNNIVFLTFGTGFGAGIIVDGKLYSGTNSMAGEIGHVRLAPTGGIGFGKAGSCEGFCSGGGMAQTAMAVAGKKVTAKEIAECANKGEEWAEDVFRITGEKLGETLAIVTDIFNPERIIIGGIYARCRERLDKYALPVYEREAIERSRKVCEIVPISLGESLDEYASLACAVLALESDSVYTRYPALLSIKDSIEGAIDDIVACYKKGGKLLLAGNGGSQADCAHIVGELMKSFVLPRPIDEDMRKNLCESEEGKALAQNLQGGLPAMDLCSQSALVTAYNNDVSADAVYAQVLSVCAKSGDIFVGISTSGNAKNVKNAFLVAKAMGIKSILLTGKTGGACAPFADRVICVPEKETYKIQEYHLPIYHHICLSVERAMFGGKK